MTKSAMRTSIDAPALDWQEGHILGNGDIGAVVWGTPDAVKISLSKHDVNDLRRNRMREGWKQTYREMRDGAIEGKRELDNLTEIERENDHFGPYPLSCGTLNIELSRGVSWNEFRQELNMETACCKMGFRATIPSLNWGKRKGEKKLSAYAHANLNAVIVTLDSSEKTFASFKFDQSLNISIPQKPVYEKKNAMGTMLQALPDNHDFMIGVLPLSGECVIDCGRTGIHGQIRFGGNDGPAKLAILLVSQAESPSGDLEKNLKESREELLSMPLDVLAEKHQNWWKRFWDKSQISYDNEDIARFWYMGVYALASSTRPDKSPPHLQGIWNVYDTPPWHADFHFNTNIQMCQWIACRSNHPELQEAFARMLSQDWREEFRRYAKEIFGMRGIALPLCADWKGRAIGWGALGLELSITAWMAWHLWDQWLFTQDESLLKETVFPFLKECCEFYEDALVRRKDGSWNVELSHSPEQTYDGQDGERHIAFGSNPTIDLVFIRALFSATLQAVEIIGINSPAAPRWREILENLPENPTFDGHLIDSETIFLDTGDEMGYFPRCHRHPSRLVGIFPGDEIGLGSTNETLGIGIDSFKEFRSYGGDFFTGWSLAWQAAIAARLGLADDAEQILSDLKEHFTFPGFLNSHNSLTKKYGMDMEPLFQIEGTIGAAAAVNEMLVHMHDDTIFLFPGVPKRTSASFTNLRLPGNILISAEKIDDEIKSVQLVSQSRSLEIRVKNPWFGHGIKLTSVGGDISTFTGDIISFFLEKDVSHKLHRA